MQHSNNGNSILKNGRVYKIVDENNNIIYIGSTKYNLEFRMKCHINKLKSNTKTKLYQYCCDWTNYKIILIEEIHSIFRSELLKKEQFYINKYKPKLNMSNPVKQKPKTKAVLKQ